MYGVIYKVEFVSLLNYHSLDIDWASRIISSENELVIDKLVNRLLLMPRVDLEEDFLIVRLRKQEGYSKPIHISDFTELIPLTSRSLMAYRRKFDNNLVFTESKLVFESFLEFKKIQIQKDVNQILSLIKDCYLNKRDAVLQEKGVFNSLVEPIYQRRYAGKQDSHIQKGEFDNIFQVIALYQEGSHLPRTSPLGFIMHLFAAINFKLGVGSQIKDRRDLRKFANIRALLESGINSASIDDCIKKVEVLSGENEWINKSLNHLEKSGGLKSNKYSVFKTGVYLMYFMHLIQVEELNFEELFNLLKEYNTVISEEIELALMLVAVQLPIERINSSLLSGSYESAIYSGNRKVDMKEVLSKMNVSPDAFLKRVEQIDTKSKDLHSDDWEVHIKVLCQEEGKILRGVDFEVFVKGKIWKKYKKKLIEKYSEEFSLDKTLRSKSSKIKWIKFIQDRYLSDSELSLF